MVQSDGTICSEVNPLRNRTVRGTLRVCHLHHPHAREERLIKITDGMKAMMVEDAAVF